MWRRLSGQSGYSPSASKNFSGNKTPPAAIYTDLMGPDNAFAAVALPHLDAAFNLARWLTGSRADAEDVVQEAMVRALTYFPSYRGGSGRAWILQIVRNTAYGVLESRGERGVGHTGHDESAAVASLPDPADDPEKALILADDLRRMDALIARLPLELRETLVLRELEELSYRQIAQITAAPIGTVMSRLWRARRLLAQAAV